MAQSSNIPTTWDDNLTTWDDRLTTWDRPDTELHHQLRLLVPPRVPEHIVPKWYIDNELEEPRADIGTLKSAIGDLNSALVGVGGDYANLALLLNALRDDLTAHQAEITTLKSDVATLKTNVSALQTDVTALKTWVYPLTFVFGGTPVVGSMINVPLVHDLNIPANLAGSRYYNATNPLVASTFTLTVQPAGTTIGMITVSTGGVGTFSGSGSSTLVAGNILRLTATTIGGSLTNAAITIQATRR